jgi:hypothetical protein
MHLLSEELRKLSLPHNDEIEDYLRLLFFFHQRQPLVLAVQSTNFAHLSHLSTEQLLLITNSVLLKLSQFAAHREECYLFFLDNPPWKALLANYFAYEISLLEEQLSQKIEQLEAGKESLSDTDYQSTYSAIYTSHQHGLIDLIKQLLGQDWTPIPLFPPTFSSFRIL